MTAIKLISQALQRNGMADKLPSQPVEGVCCVTGARGLCIPRKSLITPSFTARDMFARPESDFIGVDVWFALRHKWERFSSWICDGKDFVRLTRAGVRDVVLAQAYPQNPWAGYLTTSYKKHGALLAPVNSVSRRVWLFEGNDVDLSNHSRTMDIWTNLNHYLTLGVGLAGLVAGKCRSVDIKFAGPSVAVKFERWASNLYRSQLYQMLCNLLPSIEERKNQPQKNHEIHTQQPDANSLGR